MTEIRPFNVRATFEVEVDVTIDAHTPEEAESIFETEFMPEVVVDGVNEHTVELLDVFAIPAQAAEEEPSTN